VDPQAGSVFLSECSVYTETATSQVHQRPAAVQCYPRRLHTADLMTLEDLDWLRVK